MGESPALLSGFEVLSLGGPGEPGVTWRSVAAARVAPVREGDAGRNFARIGARVKAA